MRRARARARALALAGLVCALVPQGASAQGFLGLPLASPAPGTSTLDALFDTSPITLDGVTLLRIAVPAAADKSEPVAVRANSVDQSIDTVLGRDQAGDAAGAPYDPASLHVEIVRDDGQVVLEAADRHHRSGLQIVTVTSADADYNQLSIDALAAGWRLTLQHALVHALQIRQPETQRRNAGVVLRVAGGLVALSLAAWLVLRLLAQRITLLVSATAAHARELDDARERVATLDGADGDPDAAESHRNQLVGLALRALDPEARLGIFRAVRLIVVVLLILAWFGAITYGALLFPQTAAFGNRLRDNGFAVATIWVAAIVLDRLLSIAVTRIPTLLDLRAFGGGVDEDRDRQLLRAPTIARALDGFKSVVLAFVALLATLAQLGIPVGSVVTIGGVAAIAVSLAAQNLIRDVVSGFLVLIEDQYVVGDFVTINSSTGTPLTGNVERLTLRMAQVRDRTGSLVTISHSSATVVINHSRNWSRVDYEISIDPAADLNAAMSVVRTVLDEVQRDPVWAKAIVEPPEWIGVESITRDGAVVRTRIKTAPLRQFALRRELNARIGRAFAAAKIGFGAAPPPDAM